MSTGPTSPPRPPLDPPFARVSEDDISLVVETFYSRAREDDVLGPVFLRHVDDWPAHFERLKAFWSSVLNLTGRYDGMPMRVHAGIGELSAAHFDRWLALFEETLADTVDPRAAAEFLVRARNMADAHKRFLFR
ncbi:group III truncated hemoglobin [Thalassobaculum sp.]|uniref:group III truncated hemoglobin n=1 Tax=Thalassobaculum sp. TaxID=2022740 RepID=UPI0032EBA91A